jgi:DNA-binding NarL/FixJ family response regulator
MSSIRLLIADDHEVVRAGIASLLKGTEIEIVGQAASGPDALRLVRELKPDAVMLDIRMAEGDGLTALGQIKTEKPDLPVIVMSTFDNPAYLARALELGASGYLPKGCSRDSLLEAVRTVAAGGTAWSREELRRLSGSLATPRVGVDVEAALTQRECEVLSRMSTGQTNKKIAEELEISYETVKEHVQHILRKIGVSDRTQAAVWAVRKGLI